MVTSSKRTYATHGASQVCYSQSPCSHTRPLLTHASAGDTQTLKVKSGSVSVGIWVLVYNGQTPFLIKLWEIMKDRIAWRAAVHGVAESGMTQ